jgi:hypothetical protein
MHKINTLFVANGQLEAMSKKVQAHLHLQQLWQIAAPKMLAQASFISSLDNKVLTVYADSAIVANKIKLTHASLLTQLENLQNNNPKFRECKVTAIVVKVQVKSHPKEVIKTPRTLSKNASNNLEALAQNLLVKNNGKSTLAAKLRLLASKTK